MEVVAPVPPIESIRQSTESYIIDDQFSVQAPGNALYVRMFHPEFPVTDENPHKPSTSVLQMDSKSAYIWHNGADGSFATANDPAFAVCSVYEIDKATKVGHVVNVGLNRRNDDLDPESIIFHPGSKEHGLPRLTLADMQRWYGWSGYVGFNRQKLEIILQNMGFPDQSIDALWKPIDATATRQKYLQQAVKAHDIFAGNVVERKSALPF